MLSPAAQDVPLAQEVVPPWPEHLAVSPYVSLCWAMDEPMVAFVCGHGTPLLHCALLSLGSQKEPVELKSIQGQADGWELAGEWHQSGVAAPSMVKWDISTPYLHCTFPA